MNRSKSETAISISWNHIEKLCIKEWGQERWDYYFTIARSEFSWLRNKLAPFKDKIDESWFLRREYI